MTNAPKTLLLVIILVCAAACQSPDAPISTPTPTVAAAIVDVPPQATRPLRSVADRPTLTASPTAPPLPAQPTISPPPAPTAIVAPTLSLPTLTPFARPPLPEAFIFGRSAGGRDLTARRLGDGPALLMLVGAVHGGWESNTAALMRALIAHFEATPADVLPGVTLVIVPELNPDGVALGRTLAGRFNAHGVDLNRNWGCGWQPTAYFQSREVNPGSAPLSEPETQALAALIHDLRPGVVLLYHSAADGVFAGDCQSAQGEIGGQRSRQVAAVLGAAAGYGYGQPFTSYPVTGSAPAWIASLGIAAADVELATWREPEFERNLRGVLAVQCWLLEGAAAALPACLAR